MEGLCRYTLGGFYLAHYDSSPAGVFDEVFLNHKLYKLCQPYGFELNDKISWCD